MLYNSWELSKSSGKSIAKLGATKTIRNFLEGVAALHACSCIGREQPPSGNLVGFVCVLPPCTPVNNGYIYTRKSRKSNLSTRIAQSSCSSNAQ
jgi:hypothetical protein